MKEKLFSKNVGVSSLVNGIAFALAVLVYQLVPTISSYQWCLYCGFLLTVAMGADKKKYPNYVVSLIAGYVWAFFYWNLGTWIMMAGVPRLAALMIGELVCTTGLLYTHLHILKNTLANFPPYMFCAVATIYSTGGTQNIPKCAISVFAGITLCIVYNMLMEIILAKINKDV
ncbi:MAG: DUF1097 family protein [Lachnospiraceae bacterium]|nr:DUF1097 family protein [Lachnospiraceae bacterium]